MAALHEVPDGHVYFALLPDSPRTLQDYQDYQDPAVGGDRPRPNKFKGTPIGCFELEPSVHLVSKVEQSLHALGLQVLFILFLLLDYFSRFFYF